MAYNVLCMKLLGTLCREYVDIYNVCRCPLRVQVEKVMAERETFAKIVSCFLKEFFVLAAQSHYGCTPSPSSPPPPPPPPLQAKSQQKAKDKASAHQARHEYAISKLEKRLEVSAC